MGRSKAAFELESRPICLVSILGGDKRMNSTKSCRHTTFSDIRSNALNCGLLLAFILLVFPMNMTDAVEEEDKRAGFVGMRGKKDATFYDLYGGGGGGSDYNSAVAPDSDAELLYQLKRSGFVGMRGKKNEELSQYYEISRLPRIPRICIEPRKFQLGTKFKIQFRVRRNARLNHYYYYYSENIIFLFVLSILLLLIIYLCIVYVLLFFKVISIHRVRLKSWYIYVDVRNIFV